MSGSNLLIRIRPSTGASVEPTVAGEGALFRRRVCSRVKLQLLDHVPALLQQRDHAAWSGEMKRACDNRGGLAGFQFRLDSRNPFHVAIIDETRRNPWRF